MPESETAADHKSLGVYAMPNASLLNPAFQVVASHARNRLRRMSALCIQYGLLIS
jgi:hypothetical protein